MAEVDDTPAVETMSRNGVVCKCREAKDQTERYPRLAFLADWRVIKGYTQEALGGLAGVSVSTIALAERDWQAPVQPSIARKLEEVLGVEPWAMRFPSRISDLGGVARMRRYAEALETLCSMISDEPMVQGFEEEDGTGINDYDEIGALYVDWIVNRQTEHDNRGRPIELPDSWDLYETIAILEAIYRALPNESFSSGSPRLLV
jgi:transcriptional regulator with XRE-family HTH domain